MPYQPKEQARIITNSEDVQLLNALRTSLGLEALVNTTSPENLVQKAAEEAHVVLIDYQNLPSELKEYVPLARFLTALRDANGMKIVLRGYSGDEQIQELEQAECITDIISPTDSNTAACLRLKNAFQLFLRDRDSLTKLYNGDYLRKRLREEFAYTKTKKKPLSIALFDLDGLKQMNTENGYDAGNELIQYFAAVLKQSYRKRNEDIPGRWFNGDEFMIISRETNQDGAYALPERVLQTIRDQLIELAGNKMKISASVGLATYDGFDPSATTESLVREANYRLLQAKEQGKNRVCGYREVPTIHADFVLR
ncbi:GGDEF domain-containing protein [Candidatus Woesearchaeota archaeon]|nr:GGDEF domain-containing protein [Candidatus Woesearchaeota archaeon]